MFIFLYFNCYCCYWYCYYYCYYFCYYYYIIITLLLILFLLLLLLLLFLYCHCLFIFDQARMWRSLAFWQIAGEVDQDDGNKFICITFICLLIYLLFFKLLKFTWIYSAKKESFRYYTLGFPGMYQNGKYVSTRTYG